MTIKKHDKVVCVAQADNDAPDANPVGMIEPGKLYCVASVVRETKALRLVGLPAIDPETKRDRGWPAHLFKRCGSSPIPSRPSPPVSSIAQRAARRAVAIRLAAHLYRSLPNWFVGVSPDECARRLEIDAAEFKKALGPTP